MRKKYSTYAQIHPYLPPDFQKMSEAQALAKARRKSFIPYKKFDGERSQAYFLNTDVAEWFKNKYSDVWPDSVAALLAAMDAGFAQPESTLPARRKNQARKKGDRRGSA